MWPSSQTVLLRLTATFEAAERSGDWVKCSRSPSSAAAIVSLAADTPVCSGLASQAPPLVKLTLKFLLCQPTFEQTFPTVLFMLRERVSSWIIGILVLPCGVSLAQLQPDSLLQH